MKKLTILVFLGLFYFCASLGVAQNASTPRQEIVKLTAENQTLKRQILDLQKQIQVLQQKLSSFPTKPYYLSKDIETLCEKYPRCVSSVQHHYKEHKSYQVISLKKEVRKDLTFWGKSEGTVTYLIGDCRQQAAIGCFFEIPVAKNNVALK